MNFPKNPTQKWIALIVIITILGGLVAFMMSKRSEVEESREFFSESSEKEELPPSRPAPTTPAPEVVATPTNQKSTYKDGTYSAVGNYVSPGGADALGVTLVLKDNVVTDVSFTQKASNPASKSWQEQFTKSVKPLVVGKKLDEIQLDTVSGSSLTPIGFMDALAKIKVQAKA